MRIIVFGNTNNYPLRLVQALRKLGHDAVLVVERREPLHRPESVHPEFHEGRYPEWIVDFSYLSEDDYVGPSPRIGQVISLLESADALILNSLGPSLLEYVDKPAIAFLTGSDLNYYANYTTVSYRASGHDPAFRRSAAARLDSRLWTDFIQRQREGILKSKAVSYFHRGIVPSDDVLLDEIGVSDEQRFFIYMCHDLPDKAPNIPDKQYPRIFCGTRLTWKKPIPPGVSPLDYKGSDIMIQGVGRFHRSTHLPFEFRIFEKGMHVKETKALAEQEGLENKIAWLSEMPLHKFYEELAAADVCIEQFGDSCIGMVGLDAMAMAKPVIGNVKHEIWQQHLKEEWPICQATTPEEVETHLRHLLSDPVLRQRIGRKSRTFVLRHFSPKANARKCLDILTK